MIRFAMVALAAVALWTVSLGVRPLTAQAPAAAAPAPAKLASAGVYTKAQAERGGTLYDTACASCHELGKFKDQEFANAWSDKSLSDLQSAVKSMPMDAPGSLKPEEYADILAYFLSLNAYPAGEAELPSDDAAIAAIRVDAKKP